MPIITRAIPDNSEARQKLGGQLPATLGEVLSATVSDPLLSPTALGMKNRALARAAGRPRGGGVLGVDVLGEVQQLQDTPEMVDPDELNEEFGALGLKFNKPASRQYAELLADGKREEAVRADVIARGPSTVAAGAARFGAAFVAAALDPVNIASAFVPVVSQARYAGMVARMGKTNARIVTGMTEGFVGASVIEPITFGLASDQQLDYELTDALVNIGLGTFLGGGLHAVGGKIGDMVAARSPEVREAALKTSVAQMAEGRRPDVEAVFRAEADQFVPFERSTFVPEEVLDDYAKVLSGEVESYIKAAESSIRAIEDRISRKVAASDTLGKFIAREGGLNRAEAAAEGVDPAVFSEPPRVFGKPLFRKSGGRSLDELTELLNEQGFRGGSLSRNDVLDMVTNIANKRDIMMDPEDMVELADLNQQLEYFTRTADEDYLKKVYQNAADSDLDADAYIAAQREKERTSAEQLRRSSVMAAEKELDPRRDITADFDAADRVAAINAKGIGENIDDELAAIMDDIGGIDGVPEDARRVIAEVDAEIHRAEGVARAAKAAAVCLAR